MSFEADVVETVQRTPAVKSIIFAKAAGVRVSARSVHVHNFRQRLKTDDIALHHSPFPAARLNRFWR